MINFFLPTSLDNFLPNFAVTVNFYCVLNFCRYVFQDELKEMLINVEDKIESKGSKKSAGKWI
jgi:hypothetical protein